MIHIEINGSMFEVNSLEDLIAKLSEGNSVGKVVKEEDKKEQPRERTVLRVVSFKGDDDDCAFLERLDEDHREEPRSLKNPGHVLIPHIKECNEIVEYYLRAWRDTDAVLYRIKYPSAATSNEYDRLHSTAISRINWARVRGQQPTTDPDYSYYYTHFCVYMSGKRSALFLTRNKETHIECIEAIKSHFDEVKLERL